MNYYIQNIASILNPLTTEIQSNCAIQHLLLDSRRVGFPETALFFAIEGEYYDGHCFLKELYLKGVRNFVVSSDVNYADFPEANFLTVKNTVSALQQLAAHHRKQFDLPVLGITGSNGKTVVKEWLYQLLWEDYQIVRSPKSYNSQVGVPLSVWKIEETHQLGIFEAGISQPSEMEKLEPIIAPTIGIFTNIGTAHSEGFGSDYQKAMEKLRLFAHADFLIYNLDETVIHQCVQQIKRAYKQINLYDFEVLTWSKKGTADLQITDILKQGGQTQIHAFFKKNSLAITIPFADEASIENAIHCWRWMLHFNYKNELIAERMLRLTPVAMRLEMKAGMNDCTIIDDAYNSDLNALQIALDFLEQQHHYPQKTVILSDVLQSGKDGEALYQQVADLIAPQNIHRLIGIGTQMSYFRSLFEVAETHFFQTTEEFLAAGFQFAKETILIKGARTFKFEKISQSLVQKIHSTHLEINLNALAHNLKTYKQLLEPSTKIMVMVKALAYGSGSVEIARLLQFHKVDYLAVAYADEGVTLRKNGITLPIMVMNPEAATFGTLLKYKLEPEIYSLSHLAQFEAYVQEADKVNFPVAIHLKIETGMHRLGFEKRDIPLLIERLSMNTSLFKIASVLSHLAASDEPQHDDFTHQQIERYQSIFDNIKPHFNYPIIRHILNTTGIVRFATAQMDMVRLGLGLYGIDSSGEMQAPLQNVSTLKTYISQIKQVKGGETVGYCRNGKVATGAKIATVSIGYGDGLSRRLSNGRGKMVIRGQFAPIVGNVCMDMCMLDVTYIEGVSEGDEVVVFGKIQPVQQVAAWCETITYEILTNISGRVKRVYVQE